MNDETDKNMVGKMSLAEERNQRESSVASACFVSVIPDSVLSLSWLPEPEEKVLRTAYLSLAEADSLPSPLISLLV